MFRKKLWSRSVDLGAFWLIVLLAYVVVGFLRARWLVRTLWFSLHPGNESDV